VTAEASVSLDGGFRDVVCLEGSLLPDHVKFCAPMRSANNARGKKAAQSMEQAVCGALVTAPSRVSLAVGLVCVSLVEASAQ
jgi:hypothetical protein